jgi:hypothetical protein
MSTVVWGPPYLIDGPKPVAPRHSLVNSAIIVAEEDPHWQAGAAVNGYPPETPTTWNPCDEGTLRNKTASATALMPDFASFTAYGAFACTPRSYGGDWPTLRERVRAWFEATESFAVEREFAQGTEVPTNPYLADTNATVLGGGAVSAYEGMALLEDAIGETGRWGWVHAPPSIISVWSREHLLVKEGAYLVTVNGTRVVSGGGIHRHCPRWWWGALS